MRPMKHDEVETHHRLKIAAWSAHADFAIPRGWGSLAYECGLQDGATFIT